MSALRPAAATLLALLAAACAAPAPSPESGDTPRPMRRSTTMGAGTRVASYARVNDQCEPMPPPDATVTEQPPHGTLSVRTATVIMGGRMLTGSASCRDREVKGVELWYQPDPGFRGTDAMGYSLTEKGKTLPFRATVDVR